ncbi:MAG TPA: sigma-70 family RNA polymerase sigma factor [Thermoanaerobaculia bacterium]|nr:sigma-70 family RNA polymerase sigma factor [Thermoanaerobaculia bacterium]
MSILGEPDAPLSVEELFEKLQPKLRRVFSRFRLPVEDAEDILQQSFLDLVYKQRSVYNPEAWVVATVRNRCIMYWRKRRRQIWEAVDTAVLDLLAEPEAPGQRQVALRQDLEKVLARLPKRCRSVLVLRYGLGYRSQEVADLLGYQPSSIRKVTSRCIAALTRELVISGMEQPRLAELVDD